MAERYLNLHGVALIVTASHDLLGQLEHDFYYFLVKKKPTARAFHLEALPAAARPDGWKTLFRTSRSTIYLGSWLGSSKEQRVCFFGKAWVAYRFPARRAKVYCDDPVVAYEACYLVLLSYVGEALDRRGIHRVHGLGIARVGKGALVLAPSGGGKSSLALQLVRSRRLKLLSDDTPLLTGRRSMLAFPQRIALRERPAIPSRHVRKFRRVEYGEKFVVGCEHFRSKVARRATVNWIFCMSQRPSKTAVTEIPRRRAILPLLKWLVLGYETPQVWEIFLRPSACDVLAKMGIVASRALVAARLIRGCRVASFSRPGSPAESAEALSGFLEAVR